MMDMNTIWQSFLESAFLALGAFAMIMVAICGIASLLATYVDEPKPNGSYTVDPIPLMLAEGLYHSYYPPVY